jgi:hypothetical protein
VPSTCGTSSEFFQQVHTKIVKKLRGLKLKVEIDALEEVFMKMTASKRRSNSSRALR